jgi:hypothetical protein
MHEWCWGTDISCNTCTWNNVLGKRCMDAFPIALRRQRSSPCLKITGMLVISQYYPLTKLCCWFSDGIRAVLSLGYRAIAITRVLDATDWARTEKLTAAKSAGFADGENVDHLTKETIVLPVSHPWSRERRSLFFLLTMKTTTGKAGSND